MSAMGIGRISSPLQNQDILSISNPLKNKLNDSLYMCKCSNRKTLGAIFPMQYPEGNEQSEQALIYNYLVISCNAAVKFVSFCLNSTIAHELPISAKVTVCQSCHALKMRLNQGCF